MCVQAQLSFPSTLLPENGSIPRPPMLPAGIRPTKVFDTYWRFAAERQEIFFKRIEGAPPPWTRDPILSEYKFTNAYRASDRVSQYLIRKVIYDGDQNPEELFFRILLFKLFNKIETWELLQSRLGNITAHNFDYSKCDLVLSEAMQNGFKIYSAAYIMPSGGVSDRKHRHHLALLRRMMDDGLPLRLRSCGSLQEAFHLLRAYPSIGDFLAYQYVIDLNYSTLVDFSEMDFVVPGPGAKDGIRKCFEVTGELSLPAVIRMMADIQEEQFLRLGITFRSLWGRRLQLIDCQNLFCEVDKYARAAHPEIVGVTGRIRIKQKYLATAKPLDPYYPAKWRLIMPGGGQHPDASISRQNG
jgi:5-hmdU DNA kinase-like protein